MNPILTALKQGAKTYDQLKGVVGNLDHQLRYLKRTGQIVLYPCVTGPARYGLPIKVEDEIVLPKRPILHLKKKPKLKSVPTVYGPTRVCVTCGQKKRISQFGWVRHRTKRKSTCSKCYYLRHKEKQVAS